MDKIFGPLAILVLSLLWSLVIGCPHGPVRVKNSRAERYLSELPDSRQLSTLAFIGTHNSAAYGSSLFKWARTQHMWITSQLESGIRVFDMRVRLKEDIFAMHHNSFHLGMMFGDLVIEIRDFLKIHPNELVIMFIQKEYITADSSKTHCQVLQDKYMEEYPGLFVTDWSIHDTLGQHRGKILLSRGWNDFPGGCISHLQCREQNEWYRADSNSEQHKWEAIKSLQDEIFKPNQPYDCFINFLSLSANFWITPYDSARGILIRDPHNLLNVDIPGKVELMTDYFQNPKNVLYIVMADYPDEKLCNKIVESNF